jgi:hypothetical protein
MRLRIGVAAVWAGIIGTAMATAAHLALSYPAYESAEIGFLGGMGAAIFVIYFA